MSAHQPTAAGKSSYDLIDPERFWRAVALKPGMTVLDLGCGAGSYSRPLAERVGPQGKVVAVDLWAEGIAALKASAARDGMTNIEAHVADVAQRLPVADQCVDLCLMATVLHDLQADGTARSALDEVLRVLKPQGILAVLEFNKQPAPPGPPMEVRLPLEAVTAMLQPLGLIRFSAVVDFGPHLYFTQFRRLGQKRF